MSFIEDEESSSRANSSHDMMPHLNQNKTRRNKDVYK